MKVRIGFMISGVGSSEMKTNLSLKKKALPKKPLFFSFSTGFLFSKKKKCFVGFG